MISMILPMALHSPHSSWSLPYVARHTRLVLSPHDGRALLEILMIGAISIGYYRKKMHENKFSNLVFGLYFDESLAIE